MNDFLDYFENIDKKDLVIVILLLIGLVITVYSIQNPNSHQSQAEGSLYNAFNIKDGTGNSVKCNDNSCATSTLDVDIQLKDLGPLPQNP